MFEHVDSAGTLENPIVDSELSPEQALLQNPEFPCPQEILERQRIILVLYIGLDDGLYHRGQIVVEERLEEDIALLFEEMVRQKFPVGRTIPIADPKFAFNDEASMAANNTSGFNYRFILGTENFSPHARGLAIDLNPAINPCMHKNGLIEPAKGIYDPTLPGTLTASHPIVQFMKNKGWKWGGDWKREDGMVDYQHFQK
jgi:hypothetical protein